MYKQEEEKSGEDGAYDSTGNYGDNDNDSDYGDNDNDSGGGKNEGPRNGIPAGVKVVAALMLVVGVLLVGSFLMHIVGEVGNKLAVNNQVDVDLKVDETLTLEMQTYGLPAKVHRTSIWEAMRKNPMQQIEVCSSGTTFFVHSLQDTVLVNGVLVGPTAGSSLTLPVGTMAVTFEGIKASHSSGKILFILDTLPNGYAGYGGTGGNITNSCSLSEKHEGIALMAGETITVPVKIIR